MAQKNLRELLEEADVSVTRAAVIIGTPYQTFRTMVIQQGRPTEAERKALAKLLKVDVKTIIRAAVETARRPGLRPRRPMPEDLAAELAGVHGTPALA